MIQSGERRWRVEGAIFAGVVLAVGLLAGCGGSHGTSSADDSPTVVTVTATPTQDAAANDDIGSDNAPGDDSDTNSHSSGGDSGDDPATEQTFTMPPPWSARSCRPRRTSSNISAPT